MYALLISLLAGVISSWQPAVVIPAEVISSEGVDAYFVNEPLSSDIVNRINGLSWKVESPLELSDLRYLKLLHVNADGEYQTGEMICHRDIADDLLDIFRKLFDAGYRIERVVLVDDYGADDDASMAANNSSCFNTRFIAGTRKLSKHGSGMAVDINPLYNPYVKTVGGSVKVWPEAARCYAFDREVRDDIPYKIDVDDLCCRLFKAKGFEWGGDWKSCKDYQHFEK